MKSMFVRIVPLVIFMIMTVFFWRGLSLDPHHIPSAQLNQSLPSFRLSVLGDVHQEMTPERLQGQISLLNVWASWCSACMEEQVFLMKLAHQGIPIYGLNYKDTRQEATQWLTEWGNPYRLIGEDSGGYVSIDLGVYGAPETFLLDKKGVIRYRHVGILNARVWQEEFLPRMRQLELMA